MEYGIWIFGVVIFLVLFGLIFIFPLDEIAEADQQRSAETGNSGGDVNSGTSGEDSSAAGTGSGISGGGSASGSGGGAGGGSPSGGSDCANPEYFEVSYSMLGLNSTETCNAFSGADCVDKTVTCKVKGNNIDSLGGATFNMEFNFYDSDIGIIAVLDTVLVSQFIDSQGSYDFSVVSNFQGADANKNMDCFFRTTSDPITEVCS